MSSLTDQLKSTNGRTTALENDRLRNQKELSRITKYYGDIKITCVFSYKKHRYIACNSPQAVCGGPSAFI